VLWLIEACADFVPFVTAVFEIGIGSTTASVGLVPVGATTGSYIARSKKHRANLTQNAFGDLGRKGRHCEGVFHGSRQL